MGIKSFVSNLFYPDAPKEQRSGSSASSVLTGPFGLRDSALTDMLTLNSGSVHVSQETALSLPTFFRCVDVLSSSFAKLPGELLKADGTTRLPAYTNPVRNLQFDPNPSLRQTAFDWKKNMFVNALLWGNAYARIIRNGVNRPVALKIYHPRQVLVTTDIYQDVVFYRFPDVAQSLSADDVVHIKFFSTDGITGRSVIHLAPEVFRIALQARRFSTKLLENGATPAGIIKHQKTLSNTAKQNIKTGWFDTSGGDNVGSTAVLDEGMDYQQVGIDPDKAQLTDVVRSCNEEICRMVGLPPHMAGILERSTNNNIEHQGIEYVMYALTPYVTNFEQELDYKLLRVQERGTYYHNYDVAELLRGDLAAQEAYYRGLRNAGIISANEVRDKINLNPYKGGDKKFIQGAMMPLDEESGLPIYPPKTAPEATSAPESKNGRAVNGASTPGHTLN